MDVLVSILIVPACGPVALVTSLLWDGWTDADIFL